MSVRHLRSSLMFGGEASVRVGLRSRGRHETQHNDTRTNDTQHDNQK